MRPGTSPAKKEDTVSETPNPSTLKLGAVAVGGYVLGRLKKGRAAVTFAMWLAGSQTDPKRLLREGLLAAVKTPEGQQLLTQLRGPVFEAGKRAATSTLQSQVTALTQALQQRTETLSSTAEKGADAAQDAGEEAGGRAAALTGSAGAVS